MALVIAVAIGLNPYVATLFLATLAAFTHRLPETGPLGAIPDAIWYVAVILFGLAMLADLFLSKSVRFAPAARHTGQLVAASSAALFVAGVARVEFPLPLVAAAGAALSWGVSATVTALAARASRSPAWVGLGHIPVLMAASTAAACILPLGIARPAAGVALASATLLVLASSALVSQAAVRQAGPTRATGAGAYVGARRSHRHATGNPLRRPA